MKIKSTTLQLFKYNDTIVSFDLLTLILYLFIDFPIATALIISIFIHEASHAFMAIKLKKRVSKIHVGLFAGYANIKTQMSAREDLYVSLAGPASNFIVALLSFVILAFFIDTSIGEFLIMLSFVNFLLGIFNIFPILPLDGGHVLKDILIIKNKKNHLRTTYKVSLITSIVLFLTFITVGFYIVSILYLITGILSYNKLDNMKSEVS